jgi:hypothetical protein
MMYNFNEDGTATIVLDEHEQEAMFYIGMYWDQSPALQEEIATDQYPELKPAFSAIQQLSRVLQANAQARSVPKVGLL